MYLIVGLGNPEPSYSKTRHNMGFDVINLVAEKYNIKFDKKGFDSVYGVGEIEGNKVVLLKPQTYMNESGKAIFKAKNFYKIKNSELILIYDDIDLDEGVVKIRKQGGAGTHNGMKSVIKELGNSNFARVRIGTGMPIFKEMLMAYVIEKLKDEDYEKLKPAIKQGAEGVVNILKEGIDNAMNLCN